MRIDDQILQINKVICRHFDSVGYTSRGAVAQDVLAQLRNFLEHIMLKIYAGDSDINNSYENICKAIEYVQAHGNLKMLYKFHSYLQIVSSHYTLDEDSSERLMLKYYVYLRKVRALVKNLWGMDVLDNLEKFPINNEATLQEYYDKIAEKINLHSNRGNVASGKYYIQKIKPFFSGSDIYYEVTYTIANDYVNKAERQIAFTKLDISDYYAAHFSFISDSIDIIGKTMPITIINGWEVAIRDCEYKNFSAIIHGIRNKTDYREIQAISRYLTDSGNSLSDLVTFSNHNFEMIKQSIGKECGKLSFFHDLEICRNIIIANKPGGIILRYLLYHMNNTVIKSQFSPEKNNSLSNLFLSKGCIPFEKMPFIYSPIGHNPRLGDLFDCIPANGRKHELLARNIRNNTEISGNLFTTVAELEGYDDIDKLKEQYNGCLWTGHKEQSRLVIENGQIFINGYKEDTKYIIKQLQSLSSAGITNYRMTMQAWLNDPNSGVDCDEKKEALLRLFEASRVAVIYGAAGTGKSTMINHIAHFFAAKEKLFLAQTHPAIDNLRRKVTAGKSEYMTVAKFLSSRTTVTEKAILIIDECSTISNRDMRAVLEKAKFLLLVLVGDPFQISSIRFGNWFSLAKPFIPATSISELKQPFRTTENELLTLWNKVRNMEDSVQETIDRNGYSANLDATIFDSSSAKEITLCLNYDGLYGINNINRFLQQSNPHTAVQWGIQQFKVGDPILFSESERLAPAIYNNTKGTIVGIQILNEGQPDEQIQFEIELTNVINGMDAVGCDFELLENSVNGNSVIRLIVSKRKTTDDDDDYQGQKTVVPFQIAYAVSIHKAQGLEYESVKIIITEEVDELITHNIFYTAITRAQKKLKIYWTPEIEHKVLDTIKIKDIRKDLGLMRKYIS